MPPYCPPLLPLRRRHRSDGAVRVVERPRGGGEPLELLGKRNDVKKASRAGAQAVGLTAKVPERAGGRVDKLQAQLDHACVGWVSLFGPSTPKGKKPLQVNVSGPDGSSVSGWRFQCAAVGVPPTKCATGVIQVLRD